MTLEVVSQKPIQYILVDGDGTIWPTHEPPPEGYHAGLGILSQFIKRGNEGTFPTHIGLCTGRELLYIQGAMRSLEPPNCWSVLENGLYLYNLATGDRINHPLLTQEVKGIFQEIRVRLIPAITLRFPVLQAYFAKEVHIALERNSEYINPADFVNPIAEMLSEFARFVRITSSSHAVDILIEGVDKGSGMIEMCARASMLPEQVLVIGDSPNDFPAMDLAGFVGCPSNALQECKDLVNSRGERGWVSEYPYVEGVVDVIRHFVPESR